MTPAAPAQPDAGRQTAPHALVLLAAGRGERMRPLTASFPKALLPLPDGDGLTVLDTQLQALLPRFSGECVVVTGFASTAVQQHLRRHHGPRVRTVFNPDWADDVNIGSVQRGVEALDDPARGYLVVETDLLLDEPAWDVLAEGLWRSDDSFWICRGAYGPRRTGGVVHAGPGGWIDVVDYRPEHDPACDGWPKMLGMLAVGPAQVQDDRALRRAALKRGLRQYYLQPWREGLDRLRARVLAVEDGLAVTFNTPAEFAAACAQWQAAGRRAGVMDARRAFPTPADRQTVPARLPTD